MTTMRMNKYVVLLLVLLAAFAGCKGESPTAPQPTGSGSGGGTGGGTTGGTGSTGPVTGATVVITTSPANPVAGSTSTVTATVTVNNQPAPNGTAVEFSTNFGTFTETGATTALRTTTNGVATVTLSSTSPGPATVQAVVNNVIKTATVTFGAQPPPPQCGDPGQPACPEPPPTITSVNPTFGAPAGGQTVTITGTGFNAPVRVFFDFGAGTTPKEAFVTSVTPTRITVLSPSVDLGTGQTKAATIIVVTHAGTANEQRATSQAFTYQAEVLTPVITTLSPASGPIDGGTRVTIFGDAFQAPVQVFFGSAEAQVVNVSFKQIIVMSPAARDTAPGGSGSITGPVAVRVVNINSGTTSNTLEAGFRYTPKMQITAAGPTEGQYNQTTRVTIDGIGFNDPVAVSFAGFAGQPIKVSGTQVIANAVPIQPPGCADIPGAITVTNVDNGDSATFTPFVYRVPKPVILSVGGNLVPGGNATVTVLNAGPLAQFTLADTPLPITGRGDNADGTSSFSVTLPASPVFQTQTCAAGGSIPIPTAFPLTYTSAFTTCTVTQNNSVRITPPNVGKIFLTPNPLTLSASIGDPAATPPVPPTDANGSFTIVNNGAGPLTITSVSGGNGQITVTPPPLPTVLQPCDQVIVNVHYTHQAAGQSSSATITVTANNNTTVPVSANETVIGTTQ